MLLFLNSQRKEFLMLSNTTVSTRLSHTVFPNHHRFLCYTTPYDSIHCPGHVNQYLVVWSAHLRAHSPISSAWLDSRWCPYQRHAGRRQEHLCFFEWTRAGNAFLGGGVVCALVKRGATWIFFFKCVFTGAISKWCFYFIYDFSLQTWNTVHCPLHRLGKKCWAPTMAIHPCRRLGLNRLLPSQTLWKVRIFLLRQACSLDKGTHTPPWG